MSGALMLITALETIPDGQLTFVSSVGITLVYNTYREALQSAVSVARSNHRHLEKKNETQDLYHTLLIKIIPVRYKNVWTCPTNRCYPARSLGTKAMYTLRGVHTTPKVIALLYSGGVVTV
jgi:hypothetical protein